MKTIDCRGKSCPAPVIATKKALEENPDSLCVLLDDGAPRENVTRFVKTRGFSVTETPDSGGWSLIISGSPEMAIPEKRIADISGNRKTVLLITSEKLGDGSEELGKLLMRNFIFTLLETSERPDKILFLNSGVLLAVKGAETLEALDRLSESGVEIFSCGICLDFYGKKDELASGVVTNMFSTAEELLTATSVIRL